MKILIALTGEIGGGKGTVAKILQEELGKRGYTVSLHRFSDVLYATLGIWEIPPTRKNLQRIAVLMRGEAWEEMTSEERQSILASAVKKIIKNRKEDVVIIDGVRWWEDVPVIRGFPNSIFLYITASPEKRYERRKKANEKSNEGNLTWEGFLENEKAPNEVLIPDIGKMADRRIVNENSLGELEGLVRLVLQTDILPKLT